MTTYTVHLYREMRLVFRDIEAGSPEEAADFAVKRGENPEIHDCEGRTFQAIADLILDDELEDETDVVFEDGRLLNAVPSLLEALTNAERFIGGFEDDHVQESIEDLLAEIRAAIALAKGAAQ